MTFWINLNGAKIGTFAVKQRFIGNNLEKTIWETSGSMGKDWKRVRLTIKGSDTYKVSFIRLIWICLLDLTSLGLAFTSFAWLCLTSFGFA